MSRYIKLVNFEIKRFMKIYLGLIAMILVLQFAGVFVKSLGYMHQANQAMYEQSISKAQYIANYGLMDFTQICRSSWFLSPIVISATVLLGYMFLIWYRDWFGKNTFIYRLLMLPTTRLNIYFAKATAILLFTLGLIALEIIILPIQISIFTRLVPADFRVDLPVTGILSSNYIISTIIPGTFIQFFLYYSIGFMVVLVIFTAILLERSFRWKGFIAGTLYVIASMVVFLFPILMLNRASNTTILYPEEFLEIEISMGIIVMAIAVFVSGFLLKKKITV